MIVTYYTGITATEDEIKECRELARDVREYPLVRESFHPDIAMAYLRQRCHDIALSHGLPEIEGYYGMSEKGEFVAW